MHGKGVGREAGERRGLSQQAGAEGREADRGQLREEDEVPGHRQDQVGQQEARHLPVRLVQRQAAAVFDQRHLRRLPLRQAQPHDAQQGLAGA